MAETKTTNKDKAWDKLLAKASAGDVGLDALTMCFAEIWNGGFEQLLDHQGEDSDFYLTAARKCLEVLESEEGREGAEIFRQALEAKREMGLPMIQTPDGLEVTENADLLALLEEFDANFGHLAERLTIALARRFCPVTNWQVNMIQDVRGLAVGEGSDYGFATINRVAPDAGEDRYLLLSHAEENPNLMATCNQEGVLAGLLVLAEASAPDEEQGLL